MNESTATSLCPTCNGEMLSKDDQEFCPTCLLQQGMRDSTFGGNSALQNWTPPTIDQLVDRFPNLDIESLLGQGGMGAVYKVRQKELDRPAALKILPEAVASDPSFTERFLREARLLASLSHPHIVTVYEFGERDALYFILMEHVDGVTLRQASLADPIKRLAPAEALEVVGQLCDALQFAHDEGVVHRDIKPENILIDKRGRVKIADFGLARLLGKPADLPTLTRTHQLMGTPTYMAPEQIEGQPVIDHRADIYSLGVVFYELLTGELPLGRFQPPSEKVQLDARLDEVVFRTLEKEPNRRYQQASDVRTDMNAISTARATADSVAAACSSGSSFVSRTTRLLIVCWAFIGTSLALSMWGLGEFDQQLAIGVAVTALTGALLQVHRASLAGWKRTRFAAGFLLGAVLPSLLLVGTFRKMQDRLDEERSMADQRTTQLGERVAELDRELQQANRKLSEQSGDEMDSGMGRMDMGDYGGSGMAGGMGMMGGGMGMGGGDYGGDYGAMGMGMMGGMRTSAPAPFILLEENKARLSPTVTGFSDDEQKAVNEILTDIHQKYLSVEAEYSNITVGKDDSVTTAIYDFGTEWEHLENELWARLDDAVDVKQQRILRRKLKPEYMPDAEHSMPGLLGWRPSISAMAKPRQYQNVDATVRIRRMGKWVEAEINGDPGTKPPRVIPSSPKLPEELLRFDHKNSPRLAIINAQSALAREDWSDLAEQFTPLARYDIWSALYASASEKDPDPDLVRAYQLVSDTGLNHPWMAEIVRNPAAPFTDKDGTTTVEFAFGVRAYGEVKSINDSALNHPSYAERVSDVRRQMQRLSTDTTEYLLLKAMLLNQALGKPALPIFEGDNTELTIEVQDGNSARGLLKTGVSSPIPISFRLVDDNWKIDGILTPETSLLMQDPEPTPAADAAAAAADTTAETDSDSAADEQ